MEDLSSRTAQEVLDDHLKLAENWGGEVGFERGLEEDISRNVSEGIVILTNRGTFHGHEGVRLLNAASTRAGLANQRISSASRGKSPPNIANKHPTLITSCLVLHPPPRGD
jgi:hypothetical protein